MAVTQAPAGKSTPPPPKTSPARSAPKATPPKPPAPTFHDDWPPQVELILSAIEAGRYVGPSAPQLAGGPERRQSKRASYRVRGHLRLFSDAPGEQGRVIYTRDVHPRGLGFITPNRLPLGHGGVVELPTPGGKIVSIPCTLLRCREAAPGWYEGSVYFNREQPHLVPPPRKAS
jgi:hypothetical protein